MNSDQASCESRRTRLCESLAVLLMCYVFAAVHAPVPGANEPHYLAKAKHFWQSEWCAGDLFLESANAHLVFYCTVGLLTRWLDLEQTAWVARAVCCIAFTAGWVGLCRCLAHRRGACSLSCAIFLLLAAIGGLSGEWVIGGAESKTIAYGFVLAAVAARLDGRAIATGCLLGLAVAFHPVVGAWSVIAYVLSELSGASPLNLRDRARSRPVMVALALLVVCALPGLIPAARILLDETLTGAANWKADYILVYGRLKHHLDPLHFHLSAWLQYLAMTLLWLILDRLTSRGTSERWFGRFVLAAAFFVLAGFVIGFGPRPADQMAGYKWRASLLKLYPFRLFDVLLPVALAVSAARLLTRHVKGSTSTQPWPDRGAGPESVRRLFTLRPGACGIAAVVVFLTTLVVASSSVSPDRLSPTDRKHWIRSCQWIRDNTLQSALCLTPHGSFDFKWHAHRAEFVNYKDCPQDAPGVLEWNERLRQVQQWSSAAAGDGVYSAEEIAEIASKTGITHIVTRRPRRFAIEHVFSSGEFRVYDCSTGTGNRRM